MANGKRYYWMKLKESFMTSDTIDYFMSQPNGANYVVLYQMLCLKTINTAGRMSRQIGEVIIPYDVEKIRRDCKWFSADTIRVALQLYQSFGLIYVDVDDTLVIADHSNLVGSETDWGEKKRRQRNSELPVGDNGGDNVPLSVPQSVPTDIRDKRLDIRDKIEDYRDADKEIENGVCTAPETVAVLTIPLNDGSEYPITEDDIREWQELYPAVDILQECRNMKGWCNANPARRKTKRGVLRFINSWLAREQDRGGSYQQRRQQPAQDTNNVFLSLLESGEVNE